MVRTRTTYDFAVYSPGKRGACWLTLVGVGLVLLLGAGADVVHAGLVGCLFVTALYLGRRSKAQVSLAASAVLLTRMSPLAFWDPGSQLSIAATPYVTASRSTG